MSELLDRRARKKAQTREQIRGIAHQLFDERGFEAVTIADVARTADVAVQTVFNHFATKEELFFDGRVPWVEGPADAAYDAQHPTPGDDRRLRVALERIGVPPDADPRPAGERSWRTTIADVAADLDIIDLPVLVASWARTVAEDWASGLVVRR